MRTSHFGLLRLVQVIFILLSVGFLFYGLANDIKKFIGLVFIFLILAVLTKLLRFVWHD
jgi:hypothetical protein